MKLPKSSGKPKKPSIPLTVREIHGHSMLPVLPPGTIVFGWRWFNRLKPGDVVIFLHDNKEKIKRISQIQDNRVFVVGDHEDASTDSRHFGWIDLGAVLAKVVWPRAPKHRAEGIER
jgi:nickel-type superoxide dismutase maturation protease